MSKVSQLTRWVRRWLLAHRFDLLAVFTLLLIAGIPRLLDLGMYLTADEKNWMGRSYEFVRAFKDLRFNDMLQTTHPGVTTMWLVGAALTARMYLSHVPFSFNQLAHFAQAAQLPVAVVTTITVPAIYLLLRRLILRAQSPDARFRINPSWLAYLAAFFIALDPLLIGYGRVVHVDALLTHLLFVAVLATLNFRLMGYPRHWLVVSAALSAAALLTKAPAIFMVPYLALVILTDRTQWRRPRVVDRSRDVVAWLLLLGIIFVLAWPALIWVPNPEGNVLVLKRDLVEATVTPHHMVEDYTLNAWHYPAALLTRTTPVTLLFLVFTLAVLLTPALTKKNRGLAVQGWLLLAYIFFFIVMMTLGAKKGDRYILPVWPAIDVLAAVGVVIVSRWLSKVVSRKQKEVGRGIFSLLTRDFLLPVTAIAYLVITVYWYHPYAVAYSNPVFPDNLSQELGWGEGLEQVATWLNQNAPHARVASWYPEELQAYTTARVSHINAHAQPAIEYVVMYRNMFGRAPDHYANDFIDEYYKKRDPVFVAQVVGKEFAWVYPKHTYETVTPDLIPGVSVRQMITVPEQGLRALEVQVATYQGRAKDGELVVEVRSPDLALPVIVRQPIASLTDNGWVRVVLPAETTTVDVTVSATGTAPKLAPAIRLTRQHDYRPGSVTYPHKADAETHGDLAVRLLYERQGQLVSEEETKLLKAVGKKESIVL